MRPFDDEYEELDEPSFESFAQIRRLLGRKHKLHQKDASRKRHGRAHHDRWADDRPDSHNDYRDDEFDRHYGLRLDD